MIREKFVTINDPNPENRDNGKRFLVFEMPAWQLEKFGVRALMALGTSGITVPQEIADAGILGIALIGYQAFMGAQFAAVEPLMDEIMECVKWYPVGADTSMPVSKLQIFEVSTFATLRREWLALNTGFTLAELVQKLAGAISAKNQAASSLNTSTSPAPAPQ